MSSAPTQRGLARAEADRGRVYLVGAGPGDPGLLTARALELIAEADTILYDRLIPKAALDGARADAELLFVGKEGGGESVPQEETQALLVERAKAGRRVVRLKGGDPFVFGRGGEEALALREAGVPFEVVPGVTAGVAAPAYAGIPVTHRGLSPAVAFVTGHEDPDKDEQQLDWQALAAFPGTLVFYMGVRRIGEIQQALLSAGRPASQPVAIVERGTLPDQRVVCGSLGSIAELVASERVKAPAITLIGDVAQLAEALDWFGQGPLAGRTVAVTRARAQASGLVRRLGELGARVVQTPAIHIRPLTGPPLDLSGYDLICLTSPNGVDALFERLRDAPHPPRDARALADAKIAVIGPGTAEALRRHGIEADIVPERFVAESLVEALAGVDTERALVARASKARDVLPEALRARGIEVEELALYETLAEPLSERQLQDARTADYVTFTSSSTVTFFLEALGGTTLSPQTRIVSIGPVTTATLRQHGIEPHIEAVRHDIDGVVEALLASAAAT